MPCWRTPTSAMCVHSRTDAGYGQDHLGWRGQEADLYVPDVSPTNGSSITTVIKAEGKRLLLLGDA
jgi:hypothetical protein